MFQQRAARFARFFFVGAALCAHLIGCERPSAPAATAAATTRTAEADRTTVVSLVPAATDLILGMGAGEHLVAVSNWDAERPEIAGLPRVGDYRTIDWERIAQLRPAVMIVQFREDKMPQGMRSRADEYGIRLVNVHNNRLDEVFTTMRAIGEAIGQQQKATDAERRVRAELDAVRSRVAGTPRVQTLIALTHSGLDVVGGGYFMVELLTIAGGTNVLPGGDNSFPTIDREMLLSLDPDVVLQVIPGASPQEVEQARSFWTTVPQLSAVRNGRVYQLTEPYLLLPGHSVGKIASLFAEKLHPETRPRSDADKERP